VLHHLAWNPGQVGAALLNRTELDAEPPHQLGAQLGLVQHARGLRVAVEQPPVERRPAPVRTTRHVAHNDVRVKERVARPRRAMPKRRGNEPLTADVLMAPAAAPRETRPVLEIAQRPLDRDVVSLTHLPRDLRIAGAPQDAHALRRAERQIETGDRSLAHRLAQFLATARVARLQQPRQSLVLDAASETHRRAAAAGPLAGRFPLAGVVILAALRHLLEVVALRAVACSELP
jgi:hypothetical protein